MYQPDLHDCHHARCIVARYTLLKNSWVWALITYVLSSICHGWCQRHQSAFHIANLIVWTVYPASNLKWYIQMAYQVCVHEFTSLPMQLHVGNMTNAMLWWLSPDPLQEKTPYQTMTSRFKTSRAPPISGARLRLLGNVAAPYKASLLLCMKCASYQQTGTWSFRQTLPEVSLNKSRDITPSMLK